MKGKLPAKRAGLVLLVSLFLLTAASTRTAEILIIRFLNISLDEALIKAKSEKKPVFVNISMKWCAPCKKMKNETYRDKEVTKYFNKNFINLNIDGETWDGDKLIRENQITTYPTVLVLDAEGEVIAMKSGFMYPNQLIKFARKALKEQD